ncbi:glycosyltransferase family 2 protein [Thiobaca trueperi]|uniref:Glycosyltransferase involved in cell wall biosynthesis n=1 Tax=Thiobaca trueperi TaxID=127458 RepID=A0A4R3N2K7_9GAMM|nr:glycosyltransferase family 2 protein [Thiobaca trueperi]TCT23115.1 glycosyltransferase involved in cell wall biosynthesis [Thiobaca trueperi]
MSNSYQFTIFTPTYNRAYSLPRVYESIKRQTFRDFEWLIIDDGSTDGTKKLIQKWQKENQIPIRYYWQENAHKKAAFNSAVKKAHGELFLTLDSDDEALPNALNIFYHTWRSIPDNERVHFSAVTALCMDDSGNIIGDQFPSDIFDSNSLETYFRHRIKGEKWGFQRTDILREFPFPTNVQGLVPESVVWFQIARKYKTRYINTALRVYTPQPDSITASLLNFENRADGRALFSREILEHHWRYIIYNGKAILKEAFAYTYFGQYLSDAQPGKKWPLRGIVPRFMVAVMWPLAILRYKSDMIRISLK